jgi:hypothetical protein
VVVARRVVDGERHARRREERAANLEREPVRRRLERIKQEVAYSAVVVGCAAADERFELAIDPIELDLDARRRASEPCVEDVCRDRWPVGHWPSCGSLDLSGAR